MILKITSVVTDLGTSALLTSQQGKIYVIMTKHKAEQTLTPSKEKLTGLQKLRNASLITGSLGVGALSLAGCAPAEAPKPITIDYSVGTFDMEPDLIEARNTVLEMCNTGEGADQMRQDWEKYGFKEDTGKSWIEALQYVADFRYADYGNPGSGMRDFGAYTYPTVEYLAENCQEAAFLLSRPGGETYSVQAAEPVLTAYRDNHEQFPDANETDTLAAIAYHANISSDAQAETQSDN